MGGVEGKVVGASPRTDVEGVAGRGGEEEEEGRTSLRVGGQVVGGLDMDREVMVGDCCTVDF